MTRRVAIVVAALLVLLASQRMFVAFDQEVGRRFQGRDIVSVSEECGRAWNITFGNDSDLVGKGANFSADCERASRTRAAEALFLVVGGVGALAWGMWFGPKFKRKPLHEVVRKLSDGDIEVTGRRPVDRD